jgi:hypothetical protein
MTANTDKQIETITLASSDDLLAFLESSGDARFDWFRGQSNISDTLLPQLLRADQFRREDALLGTFVQRAGALADAPKRDNSTAWVSIAQHHGLPTRALDCFV